MAGKTSLLPNRSSAYIAIPLEAREDLTVEVVDSSGLKETETIEWLPGSMVYLKGTVGLRCLVRGGEPGSMICIILALNYDGE
jgi:hypothetical protein